jgi:hypothetical protein
MVAGVGAPIVHVMFYIPKWRLRKKGGKNITRVEVLRKNESQLRFATVNP